MPSPPLPPELQELLAKPNPAVIGTVTPDGAPNTVATWYLWEDGRDTRASRTASATAAG